MNCASLLIHPSELSERWISRTAESGVPVLGIHPEGGKHADAYIEKMLSLLEDAKYRKLMDKACEKGLKLEYEMHAMRYLLPAREFDAHPEWFRMNAEGKRTTDYNLCPSCKEALDLVAENAAMLAKRLYRSTDTFHFWLDDAKDAHCHCEKCAMLSPSDQQLTVLNHIIRRLKKDTPSASLSYLAYHDTIAAPTAVSPEDGIFIEFAPIHRDLHKPFCHSDESKHLDGLFDCFGKKGSQVLEYWYDNSLMSRWKKPPVEFRVDKDVLFADFEFYVGFGFDRISSFACYLGEDYAALYGEPDVSDFGKAYKKYTY
ncbi:MAG: DUF4838 domain-containing protein [Clostridia bacterium]|nr:DUF4838 domain-containing protein [Clostridia bacterium]